MDRSKQRFDFDPAVSLRKETYTGTIHAAVCASRYTGKERDQETGLDYFGARYYGSALGRFTSPDWSDEPQPVPYADLHNPQELNLYAIGLDNPLNRVDDDGHFSRDTYVADNDKHGGAHIDRYNKNGQNVGRYQPDGTPIKHKGKTPDPIPSSDKDKFDKAVEDLQQREMQKELDENNARPGVPRPHPLPGLEPNPKAATAPGEPPPIVIPLPGPGTPPLPIPVPEPLPLPMPMPEPIPFPIPLSDGLDRPVRVVP